MKRPVFLCLCLAIAPGLVFAGDAVRTVPIHFAQGASSASLDGSFSGYDSVLYTLTAKSGQHMTVSLTGSHNANFNVFAPGATPGQSAAIGSGSVGGDWSGALPADGRYSVQVYQMRASARRGEKVSYKVQFSIRP